MDIQMIHSTLTVLLHGVSKIHDPDKSYGEEIMELLDRVWAEVKEKNLSNTGINHVAYEEDNVIFAGIELTSPDAADSRLEKKEYRFPYYAYWKHIGPYSKLPEAHHLMYTAIQALGRLPAYPNMEIYGHWNEDPSKLETELIYTLHEPVPAK